MAGQKRQKRYEYLLSAEIEIHDETTNGQIINWSSGGIQILSVIPLNENTTYEAKFFLQRDRFGEDSNLEEQSWERTGEVVWSYPYKDGSWIGIKFESDLDIPLEKLNEYLSAEDFCHITFYSKSDAPTDKEMLLGKEEVVALQEEESGVSINSSYLWYHWGMWGMVVLAEVWAILFLLDIV